MQNKTAKKKGIRKYSLLRVVILMLILVVISGVFIFIQMKEYEKGLLDVCATGQDGYVQLVLDQINLNQNREDEEIISDILGTLDASSNKYWTFSKDQAMLFVKDITETNKYKGFTTATYYVSDSAKEFLNGLKLNRISHSEIEIEGKEYIASGVVFQYNSNEYRLCLLTNKNVFLDNNSFLTAKAELITLIAGVLVLLLLLPPNIVYKLQVESERADVAEENVIELNNKIIELNNELHDKYFYDTKSSIWGMDALGTFVEKLKERDIHPITAVTINCPDDEAKIEFVQKSSFLLGKNVLKFEFEEDILLVMLEVDKKSAWAALEPVTGAYASVEKVKSFERADELCIDELINMTGVK